MSHSARKTAWSKVGDTCPHVDEAFDDMYRDIMRMTLGELSGEPLKELISETVDKVKEQTCRLRNALIEAYEETEAEIDDLEYNHAEEIAKLERQLGEYQ